MADVKVPMRATFDGSQLQRGVMQAKTTVGSLKSSVMSATSMMAGPLGFAGVVVGVEGLRRTLRNLADEDRQMKRLESTVRRFTGLAPNMERFNREISRLQMQSVFGDTDITKTLQELVQLTGSTDKAFANLELTLNLASATEKSLSESSRLVAFAMEGMVEPLSRLSPRFREMKQEGASAAEVMAELRRFTDKAAADDVRSLAGAFDQLENAAGELADSGLKSMFNEDTISLINKASTGIFRMAEDVERMTSAQKVQSALLGGVLGKFYFAHVYGPSNARPPSKVGWGDGPFDPTGGAGGISAPAGWAPPKGDGKTAFGAHKSWYEASVGRAGLMEWGQRQGADIDDQVRGMRDLRANSRVYVENWERIGDLQKVGEDAMKEHVAQIQALSATLGSQLAGVFLDGQAGFKSMVDYWVRYLLSSGITNILANLFTGGAAGGIFGGLFGGGGGGGTAAVGGIGIGGGTVGMGYGAHGAMAQQMTWRAVRRG